MIPYDFQLASNTSSTDLPDTKSANGNTKLYLFPLIVHVTPSSFFGFDSSRENLSIQGGNLFMIAS